MTDDPAPPCTIVGARREEDDRRGGAELVRALRASLPGPAGPEALAQIFDAGALAGSVHVRSALSRAARARARGRPRLTDAGAEVALYLAGTDQLPEALRRVGVVEGTREVVLLLRPPRDPRDVLSVLRLRGDPSVYPRAPSRATMERLGFDASDLGSVPSDRWEMLAVEAGARVELSRASASRRKG